MTTRTTGDISKLGKHFSDEDAARELLESLRWPNGAVCPHCGGADPYRLKAKANSTRPVRNGVWKCRSCRKQFTVTVGTIFESSHVPISKWLLAIHFLSASKKSMSAHQLHRMLGVTYRAAWFMAHRLRHAMQQEPMQLSGTVEMDEMFVGPRRRRVGKDANWKPKTPVVALVEREGGRAQAFPVPMVNHRTLYAAINKHVAPGTRMITDEFQLYPASMTENVVRHDTINHGSKVYARGDVHTNTVEGFFGLMRRGIYGSFHHVSVGHLGRYCDEFSFRYSNRKISDGERAALIVNGAEGKRLTYKQPSMAGGPNA
jgi:transposase-like protein